MRSNVSGIALCNAEAPDLIGNLSPVWLSELFFRLFGPHDPMNVKNTPT